MERGSYGVIMTFQDKDHLLKISVAYNAYKEIYGVNLEVEQFITWLYKQYGIVETTKEK